MLGSSEFLSEDVSDLPNNTFPIAGDELIVIILLHLGYNL